MNHEEDEETGKCICGNEWPCVEWIMALGGKMTPGQAAGKAAYEAFAIGRNGYDPGFRFEGLSDEGRAAWEIAAQAAIKKHQETCCCDCEA